MGVGGQSHAPAALLPEKGYVTHFTGGWVGFMAGTDECGETYHTGIRFPDRPAHIFLLCKGKTSYEVFLDIR
jgi:hypothetical protein